MFRTLFKCFILSVSKKPTIDFSLSFSVNVILSVFSVFFVIINVLIDYLGRSNSERNVVTGTL